MKSVISAGGLCLLLVLLTPAWAIRSLDDIQLGGKYRMKLTTGDVLEGTVEFKNDSTLIIEDEGTPFKFRGTLILNYQLLEAPKRTESGAVVEAASEGAILSYEDVRNLTGSSGEIEVTITSGSTFRGKVDDVASETIYLNIDGSVVPIAREIIKQIATVVERAPEKKETKPRKPTGPLDTLYVFSHGTDQHGKQLPPKMMVGYIQKHDARGVTIKTTNGQAQNFKGSQIVRVIKHSKSTYQTDIQRYAKTLFCDESMNLVDIPPGKQDRPFFKVCIDRYEYPNKKGATPRGNVSFAQAQEHCEAQGKRLCTVEEWQYACSGLEEYTYPYGWVFDEHVCNTDGATNIETSGSRHNCVSKFGSHDMSGNIFEWVVGGNGQPMLMGGPYSKCQTVSPGVGGAAKPQTGFRCCKSN